MSETERLLKSLNSACAMIKGAYISIFHETEIGAIMERANAERVYDKDFDNCQWVILNRAGNFIKITDFHYLVSYLYLSLESKERISNES